MTSTQSSAAGVGSRARRLFASRRAPGAERPPASAPAGPGRRRTRCRRRRSSPRPRASGRDRAPPRSRGPSRAASSRRAAGRPRGPRPAARASSARSRSSPDVSASTQPGRQRVGLGPVRGRLDEPELGDVAARSSPGSSGSRARGAPRRAPAGSGSGAVDEVADRPLAELLHHLHRASVPPAVIAQREPDDEDDGREHDPVGDEDVRRVRPQVAHQERDRERRRRGTTRPARRRAGRPRPATPTCPRTAWSTS